MNLKIRPMRPGDAPAVARIVADGYRFLAGKDGFSDAELAALLSERASAEMLRKWPERWQCLVAEEAPRAQEVAGEQAGGAPGAQGKADGEPERAEGSQAEGAGSSRSAVPDASGVPAGSAAGDLRGATSGDAGGAAGAKDERVGRVAGVVAVEGNDVAELWVAAAARGRGVGSALFAAAEERIRRAGFDRLTVRTTGHAASLYERMGAAAAGSRRCPDGPLAGRELILLEKPLREDGRRG